MTNAFNQLPAVAAVKPFRLDSESEFLAELHEVFKRHNMLDRVGLCLLHRHFELGPGEVLVESTTGRTRESRVVPESKVSLMQEDMLETMWKLEKDGNVTVLQYCGRCGR